MYKFVSSFLFTFEITKSKNSTFLVENSCLNFMTPGYTVRSHLGLGNFPRPREIAIFNPREIP